MDRLLFLVAVLAALAPVAAAQGGFEGDVASIQVGENITMNATIVNPLPVSDTLAIKFSGKAITEGLVTPFYTEPGLSCENLNSLCELSVAPNSERSIEITLEGTAMGQETLTGTVNSTTTQLSSSDQMQIRVKPFFGTASVSAPGITGLQAVLVALLGAFAYVYALRD
ncbi:MAG: hypothetical protein SVW77_01135 [Candidatus Nanohaloarchaea archaeon]|nr:hypothetical protein [Candidatus Nanohaloarchaea archaeon]